MNVLGPRLRKKQGGGVAGLALLREQRSQGRALPAGLRSRHARFAEEGVLGVGVGIGVFHRDRKRVELAHQRVGHRLDQRLGNEQDQFEHQRFRSPSQPSR